MASQELRKTNGYLPGFGWMVVRPERYASPREPGSGHLLGTVARILEPPAVDGEEEPPKPVVVRGDSSVEDLSELVVQRLGAGGRSVVFRLVGEAPADCIFQVILAAQKLLGKTPEGSVAGAPLPRGPLVVAPSFGTSLSSVECSREELMASVCHWSEFAPPLPGPVLVRARHFPSFLKTHTQWVGMHHKDD